MPKLQRYVNRNVTLTGVKTFNMPTDTERKRIKDALTFENPQYLKAKKYNKYVSRIDPYLRYYTETKNSITTPIGFDLNGYLETEEVKVYDKRIDKKVYYPPFVLTLRDTQKEARGKYLVTAGARLSHRNIVQLPTGKGKTILGLSIAYALGQRTLIIVHKVDLLNGWEKDIRKAFDGKVRPYILQGTKNINFGEQITITTIQTLNRLSEEDLNMLSNKFGLIIQDEMHHCPASSYSVSLRFNAKYRLGLTATPERSDGLAHVMNLYYGNFAYQYESKGVEKDIYPVQVVPIKAPVFFDPICTAMKNGKYKILSDKDMNAGREVQLKRNQKRLSALDYDKRPDFSYSNIDDIIVMNEAVQSDLVQRVAKEHLEGHSVVVFFSKKHHVRQYYEILQPMFEGKVFTYYGDNSDKVNDRVLEEVERTRDTITLTTYAKATEGTNVRQWEVEFLVSSINNGKNVEQAVGRIRRAKENKINPVRLYDYDYADCCIVKGHTFTRKQRYRKLGFEIEEKSVRKPLFSRGY